MKTYGLRTFYKVSLEGNDYDLSANTECWTAIDYMITTHPRTLAHQVLEIWQHRSQSNLDNLNIKPLSYFKLLEYDEASDSETETVYNLVQSKKQTRSRNYDFVLHNQTLSTVESWSEPIKT